MRVKSVRWTGLLVCALLAWATGCADEQPLPTPEAPTVMNLASIMEGDKTASSVVIGETVYLVGYGLHREGAQTRVNFLGTFFGDDGSQAEVDFTVTPLYDGTLDETKDVLRWSRFGPFENPFGLGVTGTFKGVYRTTIVAEDGSETPGPTSRSFQLGVGPSIAIEQLEPLIANCDAPALRGLAGLPYEIKVRAVGFTPTNFRYEISGINNSDGITVFEHTAAGPTDTLGRDEPFVFNPIEKVEARTGTRTASYISQIRIIASSARGQVVETVLPFSIHRPMEVFYDGNRKLAQYYEPEAVSGCIPGSIGNRVTYSESTTESQQQTVSISVSNSWTRRQGVSNSQGWQEGYSETEGSSVSRTDSASLTESRNSSETYGVNYNSSESNNVGFSSSNGETWGWNFSNSQTDEESTQRSNELSAEVGLSSTVTVGAEGSIPGFAKASGSVAVQGSVRAGGRTGWNSGRRQSNNQSRGFSGGGSTNETQSFGSTTTDSMGQSMSGTFGISESAQRGHSETDMESRSRGRSMNFNESSTESEDITEGVTESEQQSWSNTTSSTTLTSFSGVIPVGRFGVFYRQTVRYARQAQVRTYDMCGVSTVQGDLTMNEWTWAPALAIGDVCEGSVKPESDLPRPECNVKPCN